MTYDSIYLTISSRTMYGREQQSDYHCNFIIQMFIHSILERYCSMLYSPHDIAGSCFTDRYAVLTFGPGRSTCPESKALASNEHFASMYVPRFCNPKDVNRRCQKCSW